MNSSDIVVEKDIVSIVSALRADGVETVDPYISQDKDQTKDSIARSSIRFQGGMDTLLRAMSLAHDVGLAVFNVGLYYSGGGLMRGPWWEMTFTARA